MKSKTALATTLGLATVALLIGGCSSGAGQLTPDVAPSEMPSGETPSASPPPNPAGTPEGSAPSSAGPDVQPSGKPWGSHTWPSGFKVTVLGGQDCVPAKTASPENVKRAVLITVRVANTGSKPYELGMPGLISKPAVDGVATKQVADLGGPCESNDLEFTGLGPKEEKDVMVALAVPEQGGKLTFQIWPDFDDDPFKVSAVL